MIYAGVGKTVFLSQPRQMAPAEYGISPTKKLKIVTDLITKIMIDYFL
jgi:hypothetical protein